MVSGGVISEYYIQLVTMHGTFMVFFAIMPLLVGVLRQLPDSAEDRTHDMAFPRINMWSFWLALLAGAIMLAGFFVPDGAPRAGGRCTRRSRPARSLGCHDQQKALEHLIVVLDVVGEGS